MGIQPFALLDNSIFIDVLEFDLRKHRFADFSIFSIFDLQNIDPLISS